MEVQDLEIVKMVSDTYFHMATVRINASSIDYVLDAEDKLLAGSSKVPRVFCEYWTFIRKAGSSQHKNADLEKCPACKEQLNVYMNGCCTNCEAKLSVGDYDWTLAKIEQAGAYLG